MTAPFAMIAGFCLEPVNHHVLGKFGTSRLRLLASLNGGLNTILCYQTGGVGGSHLV